MSWYPTLVFYFGLFDAGIIMLGGLVVAAYIIAGRLADRLMRDVLTQPGMLMLWSACVAALLVGACFSLVDRG